MDFTNPDDNVAHLDLTQDSRVAIFGAGAGGHTLAVARELNNSGKIFAIDVRQQMLDMVIQNARLERFNNIETIHANIEDDGGTKIAPQSLDGVVVPNTLFSYDDRQGILKEARRILKPNAKMLIVDWKDSYGGMGPQEENVIKEEEAIALAVEVGFTHESSFSAGAEHYGLVFSRK